MFPDKQGFLVISKIEVNLTQSFHVFVRSQKTEYIFPHLSKQSRQWKGVWKCAVTVLAMSYGYDVGLDLICVLGQVTIKMRVDG